jgi:hypothetical protein
MHSSAGGDHEGRLHAHNGYFDIGARSVLRLGHGTRGTWIEATPATEAEMDAAIRNDVIATPPLVKRMIAKMIANMIIPTSLYRHNIRCGVNNVTGSQLYVQVISNSSKEYTAASFIGWLYASGYRDIITAYPCSGAQGINVFFGLFAPTIGDTVSLVFKNVGDDGDQNQLQISPGSTIFSFSDRVQQIN